MLPIRENINSKHFSSELEFCIIIWAESYINLLQKLKDFYVDCKDGEKTDLQILCLIVLILKTIVI